MRPLAIALALLCCATSTSFADVAGVAIPRRSRQIAPNHFVSARSFRKTVVFFRRQLSKRGTAHGEIPVYRYRGVLVTRFIAEKSASWNAVHVFKTKGKTYIYVVPKTKVAATKGVDPPSASE